MSARIEIKHRRTGAVLYADEGESVREVLERAVRAKANLGGADLGGADLVGANLGGANLGGANLGGADLVGAYLVGAYLGGAYLGGAYLGGRKIAAVPATGVLLAYRWMLVQFESGDPELRYGCEQRTLADWRENLVFLCQKHAPIEAARYQCALTGLLDLCGATLAASAETASA